MRERPQFDPRHHRMPDLRLDAIARHIRGGKQDERDQHEQRRDVKRPARRIPQKIPFGARQPVAVDDERETSEGNDGVDALPRIKADARDRAGAKTVGENANGVNAEEDDEAEEEVGHAKWPSR